MTEQEALTIITDLVHKVSGKTMAILPEHDLRKDGLLDSLDMLIFFMELENETGLSVPESARLIAEGWYSVGNLCSRLAAAQSS